MSVANIRKLILNMANTFGAYHKPLNVIVEGNIGCGKTTFLNYFKKNENICVLSEPIEFWRNCQNHNLLGYMYNNPSKWSFTFQSYVQLTMLRNHTMSTKCSVKLMERSIYSARYCFVEKMRRDGLLSEPSAAVIDEWFQWLKRNTAVDVDLIVYLRTSPEVVYERMKKRNRDEEKSVPLEYLEGLHDLHEQWLAHQTLYDLPCPVHIIDANLDLSAMEEEYEKCETQIFNPNIIKCLSA